jgi:AraC-like DNA-binding protein
MQSHQISFWAGNSYKALPLEDHNESGSGFGYIGQLGKVSLKRLEGESAQFYFYSFKVDKPARLKFQILPASIYILISDQGAFFHNWGEQSRCLAKSLGDVFYNRENFFTLQFPGSGTYALNLIQLGSAILQPHKSLNAPIQLLMNKVIKHQSICLNELPFILNLQDRLLLEDLQIAHNPSKGFVSSQCLFVFIRIVEKLIRQGLELTNGSLPGYDQENLERAAAEIMANPFQKISIAGLAKRNGLSANRLKFLFKEQFGMTIHRFILKIRMDNANRLITHTRLSIRDIALQIGYSSIATFSAFFKRKMGLTPTQLRRKFVRQTAHPGSKFTG